MKSQFEEFRLAGRELLKAVELAALKSARAVGHRVGELLLRTLYPAQTRARRYEALHDAFRGGGDRSERQLAAALAERHVGFWTTAGLRVFMEETPYVHYDVGLFEKVRFYGRSYSRCES